MARAVRKWFSGSPRPSSEEGDTVRSAFSRSSRNTYLGTDYDTVRADAEAGESREVVAALRAAVRARDHRKASQIIEAHPEISLMHDASMLCTAVRRADEDMVQILLKSGFDPNRHDYRGHQGRMRTPLMEAAKGSWVPGIRLLASYGARLNDVDDAGASALQLAVRKNAVEATLALLRLGASSDAPKQLEHAIAPLHEASSDEVTSALIGFNADLNARDRQDLTPIHFHIRSGALDQARLLVNAGANLNLRDRLGRPPVFYWYTKVDVTQWASRTLSDLWEDEFAKIPESRFRTRHDAVSVMLANHSDSVCKEVEFAIRWIEWWSWKGGDLTVTDNAGDGFLHHFARRAVPGKTSEVVFMALLVLYPSLASAKGSDERIPSEIWALRKEKSAR